MTLLDWVVMAAWLCFLVGFGLWRGRGSHNVNDFLLAGRTLPWYAIGLSIMATQASAITFIATTGQAYADGMRFVQFYFGLPVAMVLVSAFAVPIYRKANVFTAYEFLEKRFDAKTRLLVTIIFLIQRGLGAGISLYAPAVVLSAVVHLPEALTTVAMGLLVIIYTTSGGIKAVTWADVLQMAMITAALLLAAVVAVWNLPAGVHLGDALRLAGDAGRLNAVDWHFDWNNRYTVWSGLLGGSFLALAYFGTDQSQVQRYLTGRSVGQSRLSLMFNAIAKVPLQFFILSIGALVFALFVFEKPPLLFEPLEMRRLESRGGESARIAAYEKVWTDRRQAARDLVNRGSDPAARERFQQSQKQYDRMRADAFVAVEGEAGKGYRDTNYIFLYFVTHYLPAGIVGLIVAVIFTAAMSSSSGEINSLATVTIIDCYQRYWKRDAHQDHYLFASRVATVFWGVYAVAFARYARNLGSLIEAVNQVGSYFYGGMLGAFVLAFFFPRVNGNGAFVGVLAGEAAIFAASFFTSISYLWYNVAGSVVVVVTGVLMSSWTPGRTEARAIPNG